MAEYTLPASRFGAKLDGSSGLPVELPRCSGTFDLTESLILHWKAGYSFGIDQAV